MILDGTIPIWKIGVVSRVQRGNSNGIEYNLTEYFVMTSYNGILKNIKF